MTSCLPFRRAPKEEISAIVLRQSLSSKLHVVTVMATSNASLEEQMVSLAKAMESIVTSIIGMNDQLTFMIPQIKSLRENN
ncbi:hypothetical protein J1N35_023926 [Gossypium stocksii]|uniref:Uncharacterized protein n=1 Tax=Gossypium stocksii TaxID=47602 RepID=A0A9D3VIZ9_9ROSI|nr:hypothetical protein J1N35_023926 [Gossypium stocksii]